jgi:FKBP-type peptidyl-prolyl cis-trans isomerase FklB
MKSMHTFPIRRSVALLLPLLLVAGASAQPEPKAVPENAADKVSYAIGVDVARNFKKQEFTVNLDMLMQGLKDGLAGKETLLPEKELRKVMNGFQAEVRQKTAQTRRLAADDNRRAGVAFLEENKAKPGVVTLPSGLQYRVIKAGQGRKPVDSDLAEVNYKGGLINGTVFDSTEAGKPVTLKVAALIPGWKEALKLMPVGAHWQIAIPSQLAYGDRGAGSDIGPNETLLFEVELVSIK